MNVETLAVKTISADTEATANQEGAESPKPKNSNSDVGDSSLKDGPKKDQPSVDPEELPTPVTSNFLFKTRTTRVCGKCDKSTKTVTKNLILPLKLPTGMVKTVEPRLRNFASMADAVSSWFMQPRIHILFQGDQPRGRNGISCDNFTADICLCWPVSTSRNRHILSHSGLSL